MKHILLPVILAAALVFSAGCAGSEKGTEDTEKSSTGEITETQEDTKSTETEAPAEQPSSQELSEWAQELFCDAMQKLSDEGVLQFDKDNEAAPIPFINGEKGEMLPAFSDEAKGAELTGLYTEEAVRDMIVSEAGTVFTTPARLRRSDRVPYYFPSGTNGMLLYDTDNTDAFADSFDSCRYLVYYNGFESRVDENYYGNAYNRISVTTVVFVIDVKDREVVHIETVGTDTPGNVTQDIRGKILYDRAEAYIRGIADH